MKARGSEIATFFAEWPPGKDWCFDDGSIDPYVEDSTASALDPAKRYDLGDFGCLYWQGEGAEPRPLPWGDSVASAFARWRKARKVTTFVVEVPNGDADELRALIAARGWRVR